MDTGALPEVGDTASAVVGVLNGLLVLASVCILAYLALKFGLARFMPGRKGRAKILEILDRLDIGSGRSFLLLRAGKSSYLVGVSEAGVFKLAELDSDILQSWPKAGLHSSEASSEEIVD